MVCIKTHQNYIIDCMASYYEAPENRLTATLNASALLILKIQGVCHGLESCTPSVEPQLESLISYGILESQNLFVISCNLRILNRIFANLVLNLIFLLRYPTRDLHRRLDLVEQGVTIFTNT